MISDLAGIMTSEKLFLRLVRGTGLLIDLVESVCHPSPRDKKSPKCFDRNSRDLLQFCMNRVRRSVREIIKQILALRANVVEVGEMLTKRWHPLVADTSFTQSALNLAHYLALRRHDLRPLQQVLVPLGVSLARSLRGARLAHAGYGISHACLYCR